MKLHLRLIAISLAMASTALTAPVQSQDSPEITPEKQAEVVESLIQAIDELYLYPDRGPELAEQLRDKLKSGTFQEANTSYMFAAKLTDELRSLTNDLHFAVRHGLGSSGSFGAFRLRAGEDSADESDPNPGTDAPEPGQQRVVRIGTPGASLDPDSPMFKALHEQFRKNNFSMPRLEVLPGNVGYMRLDMMPPLDVARPTLDAAMMFLSNTDALIIDVRDTPGGVGGFIPYFMSYFFPENGKLLFTRYFGAEDRSDEFRTVEIPDGLRRPNIPLYVLTSSSTGSAAENLAFTLKNHGRAKTVGETTRGGGHSARMAPLIDGFMATIPAANVIHPETGKGFDGVGVLPSISVNASEALDSAHEMALETLLETAADSDANQLVAALEELRAARELESGVETKSEAFKAFVGKYGVRAIFIESNQLKYQRDGGPALVLRPVGNDTFRMSTPPSMRSALELPDVRFERDEDGEVKGFSLVRNDEVEAYIEKETAQD